MPKYGNPHLFHLIKSLTKTEKVYFKKFSELHVLGEKNNYLKLFDAIDRQEVYDEKKLLREEKYIKQLPYLKNYLTGAILKAMQNFYSDHTQGHRLRRAVDNAWFLFKKGMYTSSREELERARETSFDLISGSVFLEAMRMEELVFSTSGNTDHHASHLYTTLEKERELLNDLLVFNELTRHFLSIYLYFRKTAPIAKEEDRTRLRAEIELPLLNLEGRVHTFRCRKQLYSSLAGYYSLVGDWSRQYNYCRELVELYRAHPAFIEDNPGFYTSALNNLGNSCVLLGRFEEGAAIAREVRQLKTNQPHEERKNFITAVTLEMSIHGKSGDHEAAFGTFARNQPLLHKYFKQGFLQRYFTLCVFAVASGIYTGRHKQALKIVAHAFSDPEIKNSGWLEFVMEILQLVLFCALEHDTEQRVQNIRKRWNGTLKESTFLPTLLGHFTRIGRAGKKEKRQAAENFLKDLNSLKEDRHYATLSAFFDIEAYLQGQASARPLSEILRSKKSAPG
jgi:hypothetical protein